MRSVDSQPQFGQRMTDSINMSNTTSDLGAQGRSFELPRRPAESKQIYLS
jgi:hypothetical protein